MKTLILSLGLFLGTVSAFADPAGIPNGGVGQGRGNGNIDHLQAAPAPLIGLGIPSALAVGGILLGAKFLGRRRR